MPRFPITAPPQQPPVVNLVRSSRDALAAANGGDETDGRWIDGFSYLPESNVTATTVPVCGAVTMPTGGFPQPVTWQPVLVTIALKCSITDWQAIDWQGRAERALDLATPTALENEFWSGAAGTAEGYENLYLAMPPVAANSGTHGPVDLTPAAGAPTAKRAFAMMEQAIANCGAGARGMIHARPEATPNFLGVRRDGNLLLTQNDTIVVPGNGYPDIGPGGSTPASGATWIFATGLTDVRIEEKIHLTPDPREDGDPDWLVKATDRSVGTVTVYAQRFAIVSWDGICHYAIQSQLET